MFLRRLKFIFAINVFLTVRFEFCTINRLKKTIGEESDSRKN